MVEKPLHPTLRLSAGTTVNLRSGDRVSVQVLKHLSGTRWAVGIKGRVVAAVSDLELVPGQRLLARVGIEGGRTVLRLHEGRGAPLDTLLRQAGLPVDPDVRRIVEGFLHSGLGVKAEQVGQVRKLLEKARLDPRRFARFAALAVEKGIDLQSPGLEELLPILGYGQGGGERRRYRGRQMPEGGRDLASDLPQATLDPAGRSGDEPLQLFNHLRGREGTWVVIPFHYTFGSSGHLYGTVRLLYDEATKTSKRLVLVVEGEGEEPGPSREELAAPGEPGPSRVEWGAPGEPAAPREPGVRGQGPAAGRETEEPAAPPGSRQWSFALDPGEEGYRLSVYCSRPARGPVLDAELRRLRLKLQNLGVKTDDTIRIDDGFDGFSPPGDAPAYRSIDLER